jgi:hypothetical protein
MPVPRLTLALAATDPDPTPAIIWSAILLAILVVLFFAIKVYRKWMTADDSTTSTGFTLSDLRRLHKEGKMTDEEFERAKTQMLGSLKAAADKPAPGPRTQRPQPEVPDEEK